jgi:hypothetical protein
MSVIILLRHAQEMKHRSLYRFRHLLGAGMLALLTAHADAQGIFFQTGAGQPLSSRSFQLNALAGSVQPVLTFDLAFATDESFAPGQLFDSFTVSVAGGFEQVFGTLVTADASGFLWAPPGSGQPINGGSISRIEVPFPTGGQAFRSTAAYTVSWPIPAQFRSGDFEMTVDLFDNLDVTGSLGYISVPVVVPEPSMLVIFFFGSFLTVWRLREGRL